MNTNLKDGFKVILFDANTFSYAELCKLSDWLKIRTAENYPDCTTIYDSLDEFQEAFNDESIDEVNNYIFFVQNIKPVNMDALKSTYQQNDNCMAEILADQQATGLSIEQAFELYLEAMNWADGDCFFVQKTGEELTELSALKIAEQHKRKKIIKTIKSQMNQGCVLDASKMKGTRIEQLTGDWDSINDEYLPCLVKTPNDEYGVDFFEKEDPIPLDEQVGLECDYPVELESITDECLEDILQAMVKV